MRFALLLLAACAPAEPDDPARDCPDALVDDIVTCVESWLEDPDNNDTPEDLVILCSDAEPLADAWDAYCAAADPRPSLCDASYETAWTAVQGPCSAEASAALGL